MALILRKNSAKPPQRTKTIKLVSLFSAATSSDYQKPWPEWAKKASARLLNICFPIISTQEWLILFCGSDFTKVIEELFSDGRVLGRLLSLYEEIAKIAENSTDDFLLELKKSLNKQEWIKKIKLVDGELVAEYGTGVREMLKDQICQNMPPSMDVRFFVQKLSRGMGAKIPTRIQDKRAARVYFVLIVYWPLIEKLKGKTTRELYNLLKPFIGKPECKRGKDATDTKDQHYKWFEKLCQQNIGLHLKPKGKRAKRIARKPTITEE